MNPCLPSTLFSRFVSSKDSALWALSERNEILQRILNKKYNKAQTKPLDKNGLLNVSSLIFVYLVAWTSIYWVINQGFEKQAVQSAYWNHESDFKVTFSWKIVLVFLTKPNSVVITPLKSPAIFMRLQNSSMHIFCLKKSACLHTWFYAFQRGAVLQYSFTACFCNRGWRVSKQVNSWKKWSGGSWAWAIYFGL